MFELQKSEWKLDISVWKSCLVVGLQNRVNTEGPNKNC